MKLHSEYVPRNSNADSTLRINFTALPGHFNSATVLSQDETIAMLDPPCLFLAHLPSILTMSTWLTFCLNLLIFQTKAPNLT